MIIFILFYEARTCAPNQRLLNMLHVGSLPTFMWVVWDGYGVYYDYENYYDNERGVDSYLTFNEKEYLNILSFSVHQISRLILVVRICG